MVPLLNRSAKSVAAVLFLVMVALAGCFGGGDDDDSDETPIDDPGPDLPPLLAVTVTDPPTTLVLGDSVDVNVTVSGDAANATWVGIRWSSASTEALDNLTSAEFEGELEATGAPHAVPATIAVTDWAPDSNGTFYLRANVQANETDYWGDEFTVDVLPEVEEGDFSADTEIDIVPVGPLATYDPDPAQISVGQAVSWSNGDAVAHTATHDAAAPLWDTGEIDSQGSSMSYRFNKAGTYEVKCTIHAEMGAQIVVS